MCFVTLGVFQHLMNDLMMWWMMVWFPGYFSFHLYKFSDRPFHATIFLWFFPLQTILTFLPLSSLVSSSFVIPPSSFYHLSFSSFIPQSCFHLHFSTFFLPPSSLNHFPSTSILSTFSLHHILPTMFFLPPFFKNLPSTLYLSMATTVSCSSSIFHVYLPVLEISVKFPPNRNERLFDSASFPPSVGGYPTALPTPLSWASW